MLTLALLTLAVGVALAIGGYAALRTGAPVDRRLALVSVVAVLAVGGAGVQAAPVPAGGAGVAVGGATGDAGAATPTSTPAADRATNDEAAALGGSASGMAQREAAGNATVVDVTSGDLVTYRTAAGDLRRVRLAGVGAPGVDGADPDRFDGVLTGDRGRACLGEYGRQALLFLRSELDGESVTVERVGAGPGLPAAVLRVDGESVNRRLVERGYARGTDGRYADAERAARSGERGLWSCGLVEPERPVGADDTPEIRIAAVHPNPAGPDGEALNDEYLVIENVGRTSVDLSDWYLVEGGGKAYFSFGGQTLEPGTELVVHVGSGRDTGGHVYWGEANPVLGNAHETLKLVDGDGERVVRFEY
jgi:micrococcal nuclease